MFYKYNEMITTIGYREHFSSKSYQYFLDRFQRDDHESRIHLLENFIASGDYMMTTDHWRRTHEEEDGRG